VDAQHERRRAIDEIADPQDQGDRGGGGQDELVGGRGLGEAGVVAGEQWAQLGVRRTVEAWRPDPLRPDNGRLPRVEKGGHADLASFLDPVARPP
jgi:hypothetical protein